MIPENKVTRLPDIRYQKDSIWHGCEVKTIHNSDAEMDFIKEWQGAAFDIGRYEDLGEGFISKLLSVSWSAEQQILGSEQSGFAYIIIHFDDFAIYYKDKYRDAIRAALDGSSLRIDIVLRFNVHPHEHFWWSRNHALEFSYTTKL